MNATTNGHATNGHAKNGRLPGVDDILADLEARGLIEKAEAPKPAAEDRSNGVSTDNKVRVKVDGHGADGRFVAGNKCAVGRNLNAHARKQAALRGILAEVVDPERMRRIVTALADLAEKGDLDVARFLFEYLLGKPGAAPDPDRLDLEEYKLFEAHPTIFEATRTLVDNVDAKQAVEMLASRVKTDKELLEHAATCDGKRVIEARDKRSGRKRQPSLPLGS
jgi:hypothetical protein